MLRYINVKSRHRNEMIDITGEVEKELKETGVKSGVCYIYVPHTTAAVTINEGADPSVRHDILTTLSRLIPYDLNYAHLEGNSDAHVKSSIVGASQLVPVDEGRLILGTWQSVYFCEFDGPRHRRVILKFIQSA
jgi:secondary thiamine-phosphate synthase enzyme